jgi:glycosyltransferase involved in cell wall biosynthesis
MTRVVLFEWTAGGHRPVYVRRLVETLRPSAEVVLVLPQVTLDAVGDLGVETRSIGEPRPELPDRLRRRSVLAEEAARFRDAALLGDHALHLYADHVLVRLLAERPYPSPTSLIIYCPRAYYSAAYGTNLPAGDRPVAMAKEWALRAWRRRPDAHAVFTLDEEAARRWARHRGARAQWLPEPPVPPLASGQLTSQRDGCVLYGALAARKGLDLLARALTLEQTRVRLVLAGEPDESYLPELEHHAAALKQSGVDVDLRPQRHSEIDGLKVLANANCAVLPYPYHAGMSRVLVEACSVGTPVVAHHFGLLGHLVRAHGLGLSVDCTDARALREAVLTLADPAQPPAYAEALRAFSGRYASDRFSAALVSGLGLATTQLRDVS